MDSVVWACVVMWYGIDENVGSVFVREKAGCR